MKDIKELLNFGLINIDKSAGPTSYSVSEFVKRQLGLKKTSHMGTLDPKVTGVLPITLGRACKLAGYFIKHDKSYVGILETHKTQKIEELQSLIDKNFTGKILQTPPKRSAVKVQEREREVYSWKLTENSDDGRYFLFECRVEGGTYVRKLCSDLGEMIGGAHMGELRRTRAGEFSERGFGVSGHPHKFKNTIDWGRPFRGFDACATEQCTGKMVNLFDFKSAVDKYKNGNTLAYSGEIKAGADSEKVLREMIVSAEDAIRKVLPCVEVEKCAIMGLHIGKPLYSNNVVGKYDLKEGDIFALFCGDVFIGIYRKSGEEIIFGRSEFVCN